MKIVKKQKSEVKNKWKSRKRLPRILRINRIRGLKVSVLFSDGHNRVLDFEEIFKTWKVSKKSHEFKLLKPEEFKKVKLENHTLTWSNVTIELKNFDGKKISLPYQVGADILYELSEPDDSREGEGIGTLIKKARLKAGLTQEELGERIGSDKYYISKIESNQHHVEVTTLRKIVEGGLHKRLEIHIK
jgi:DNA-binding XRE family transcriptional regulator